MSDFTRRRFLAAGAASLASVPLAAAGGQGRPADTPGDVFGKTVTLSSDGLMPTPDEYARLLAQLTASGKLEADRYMEGGVVAEMERAFAKELGKEQAIYLGTGTLANQLALRVLAAGKTRVIVQERSHVYNDECDCAQMLSGLNLVPLGKDAATFTAVEVEDALNRAAASVEYAKVEVGVVSVESPVRLKSGQMFDFTEMQKVSQLARSRGLKLHLDGVRIFIESAYSGRTPAEYAALFDTVLISLYKTFNAPSGAVLAGPSAVIDQIAHLRKVFGGTMWQVWMNAAIALHFLDGCVERFKTAIRNSETFFKQVSRSPRYRIEPIQNGTNVFRLHLEGGPDPKVVRENLRKKGITIRAPARDFRGFEIEVNETINRVTPDRLAEAFIEAASV